MGTTTTIIFYMVLLTILGSAALLLVTLKFYWGERGTPPLEGESKRIEREKELAMRAKQIEHSRSNPRKPRPESFWDNRKAG
jgi:hypothetical protein